MLNFDSIFIYYQFESNYLARLRFDFLTDKIKEHKKSVPKLIETLFATL